MYFLFSRSLLLGFSHRAILLFLFSFCFVLFFIIIFISLDSIHFVSCPHIDTCAVWYECALACECMRASFFSSSTFEFALGSFSSSSSLLMLFIHSVDRVIAFIQQYFYVHKSLSVTLCPLRSGRIQTHASHSDIHTCVYYENCVKIKTKLKISISRFSTKLQVIGNEIDVGWEIIIIKNEC